MNRDDLVRGFNTRAIYAGQHFDPATDSVITPLYATTTYRQSAPAENKGFEYARSQNPTRAAFERSIAALEGGTAAFAFASGQAAEATVLDMLEAGSHIITSSDLYGGTYRLFEGVRAKSSGLKVTYADLNDPASLESALRPETKLIWLETPTNPLLKIVDIEGVANFARSKGLLSLVDGTFASPWIQRPLELGIDLVLHSATKYIGGHSDVVGGVVVAGSPELAERLGYLQNATGGISSPFDCFLMHRGLKTLGVRMQRHCESAAELAEWLSRHPRVEQVNYPGLKSHSQHELAARQMSGRFGGMISLVVRGGASEALTVLKRCLLFTLAQSLGGVESLIQYPTGMSHRMVPKETREAAGIVDGLIRLSVGIEDVEDLRADLQQALAG